MAEQPDCVMETCQDNECEIVAEVPPVQILDNKQLAEEKKNEGNNLYKQKKYKDALHYYTEAIKICPDAAPYYGNRAACHMMIGNYKAALRDAKQSTELDPNFVKGYIRETRCSVVMGDIISALRALNRLKELDPTNNACAQESSNIDKLKNLETESEVAYAKEDFRMIIFLMDRALQISPASYKYRLLKAECLAFLKRFQEAQEIANDILQVDSTNIDAIHVRGTCLYYQDKIEKAFSHFQHILRLAPDHVKAKEIYRKAKQLIKMKEEGNQAFRKGQYSEAYNLYTAALEVDPHNVFTNSKLYCNRATSCAKLNKLEDAVEDCTKATELDSTYLKAYLRRAKCYMDLERYEEAVRDYEKVFKVDKTQEHKHLLQEAKLELKKSKRKDYYKVLGISKNATEDEIKKAYRKRAMVHHPDRHSSATEGAKKEQEKKFKEVGEAYSVLSDPKKRSRYDNGHDLEDLDGGGFGDIDPNNIFQAFFGGAAGPGFHFTQERPNSQQFSGFPGGFHFQFN